MKIIIGVDAGGTKTEAVAYDLSGNILVSSESSFGNVLIDFEAACHHMKEAIQDCLQALPNSELIALSLGVAGTGTGKFVPELRADLSAFGVPMRIETDVRIAHAAYFDNEAGILTIAGTGAASFGRNDAHQAMTGGWGHLIGQDRGSGYWIASQAIDKMANDEDHDRPISDLSLAILKHLNLSHPKAIKDFVYGVTKKELASLTPLIAEMATAGQTSAQDILTEAGEFLAQMTINNFNKLGQPKDIKIALKGSVILKIPQVQAAFNQALKASLPTALILTEDISSTKGAFLLALEVV